MVSRGVVRMFAIDVVDIKLAGICCFEETHFAMVEFSVAAVAVVEFPPACFISCTTTDVALCPPYREP